MSESKRLHYVGHCPGSPCATCGVVEDVRGTTAMPHVLSLCAVHFAEWQRTGLGGPVQRGPLGGILSDEPPFTRPAMPGEEPIPGALIVGCIQDERTTVERLRANLEALSDAEYLEALPRRCLGCGSKDLPCHCGRVVEARASDGDLVPDSRGYLDEPTIARTNEETDI